mgnify:CR=1 FL=1
MTIRNLVLPFALALPALAAGDAAAGKGLYEKNCVRCHLIDGAPKAAIAKMMKVEMKHLGSKEVQGKTDAVLAKESKEGIGKMKAVAISDADATNIVAFLRTLKQ